MKKVILWYCFLSFFHADAQGQGRPKDNPGGFYNHFQKYVNDKLDQDSALYYVRKLASKPSYNYLLQDLLHNSFAQQFRPISQESTDTSARNAQNQKLLFSKDLLQKMSSDTNKVLQKAVRPMFLYTKAQENSSNTVALADLTNNFISKELASGDLYENRTGRYGLLIHHIISKHASLKPLAEKLLLNIRSKLESNQVKMTDSTSRGELEKRAWYRYLYAYANYIEAKGSVDNNKATLLFKTAFDFSPDLIDQNSKAAYFYDMIFLFNGEKESFRDDYLDFLVSTATDKQEVLTAFLEAALITPGYKSKLKAYYDRDSSQAEPFEQYWTKAINKMAKAAPSISLSLLDGMPFRSGSLKGKWILVDFWGTWCVPCRAEHPDLEKFYQTTIRQNPTTISLLTIACKDTYDKVSSYMNQKKLSFPVAMSDGKIENTYLVQSYPTKVLITPEGKYIVVPFGADWINFVKQYSGL